MKKFILISILSLTTFFTYAQNRQTKLLLAEIEGQWSLDQNQNITYQHIVEIPGLPADEIYTRAYNYFIYNYGDANKVIQNEDKDAGLIVAKGIFNDISFSVKSAWHIVRIDTKEGKARILLSLTQYEISYINIITLLPEIRKSNISNEFPANTGGKNKNVMGEAFYETHLKALDALKSIENALREGNTIMELEDKHDW